MNSGTDGVIRVPSDIVTSTRQSEKMRLKFLITDDDNCGGRDGARSRPGLTVSLQLTVRSHEERRQISFPIVNLHHII